MGARAVRRGFGTNAGYGQGLPYGYGLGDAGAMGAAFATPGPLQPNSVVRILFDYVGTERGVLSLRAGDVATLLEFKDQGWCMLKTTAGQEGYFPQSYVRPAGAISAAPPRGGAAPSGTMRCEVHGKNRSATVLMEEPNPLTGGATMRWVCKPGCECKGASSVGPPSAAQQASHAQMLLAAQAAAAEYMAKHASGQTTAADGSREWALPGYMTTAAATALSSNKPLSASGLTPEQLKAAAEATAVALAGNEKEAKTLLIPCARVIGKMTVLAPYENKEGAKNAITSPNAGDQVDLIKEDEKGWTLIKTSEGKQGYYPTAFLKLKEGSKVKGDAEDGTAPACASSPTAKAGSAHETGAGSKSEHVSACASLEPAAPPNGCAQAVDSAVAEQKDGESAEGSGDAAVGTKRARPDEQGERADAAPDDSAPGSRRRDNPANAVIPE